MKLRKITNKKTKGQSDIIYFIVAVVALLILAPIMLKIVNTSLGSFSTALNASSPAAAANVSGIHEDFTNFWDWLIALGFLVNVIMLFVFSFMVDSHPIFALFYFISSIIILMFSHTFMYPIEQIMGMSAFSAEVLQLPITDFIVTNFDILIFGIILLTGIIMYGKFRSGGGFQR